MSAFTPLIWPQMLTRPNAMQFSSPNDKIYLLCSNNDYITPTAIVVGVMLLLLLLLVFLSLPLLLIELQLL